MGVEIERKFLLKDNRWKLGAQGLRYCQAYLSSDPDRTVRVRIAETAKNESQAWLTIKGRSQGPVRAEYEYPIPLADAQSLIGTLCNKPPIEKLRYHVTYQGDLWEIDEFEGDNVGLVIAEIELESADQKFMIPPWLGREVTDESRYSNARLATQPFTRWVH